MDAATAYNVYESEVSYFSVVPSGVSYGFIGTCTGNSFVDSNIGADFSQTPPVAQNPFIGEGVSFITVTNAGLGITSVPNVTLSGGSPSIPASAYAIVGAGQTPTITAGGTGYSVGDTIFFGYGGLVLQVLAESGGVITSWSIAANAALTSGSVPSNPLTQISTSGSGTGAQASVTWGVTAVVVLTSGAGYSSTPTVGFSVGSAAATATLDILHVPTRIVL